MQSAYRNIGYVLLLLPLVVIAGFWIPYFSEIRGLNRLSRRPYTFMRSCFLRGSHCW